MTECNCLETYRDDNSMRFHCGDKVQAWDGEIGIVFHVARVLGHDRLHMAVTRDLFLRREGNQTMFREVA